MGIAEVCVTYNSPDVTNANGKDRRGEIWGKLVPFGMSQERWLENDGEATTPKPWRAGANETTVLTVSHDVLVEGKPLPAGSYGLFFIPGEKQWELILSTDAESWGHYFYNERNDALRVTVTPEKSEYREWLAYDFTIKKSDSTRLVLLWEDLKVPIEISLVNVHATYINEIKKELQTRKLLYWYNWHEAAKYCLDNNVELEQGLQWIDKAIDQPWIGMANFSTLRTKAELLYALNRKQEADSLMKFAIEHTAGVFELHNYGRELLAQNRINEAAKVFTLNAERHPTIWVTKLGLARLQGVKGDFKNALKNAEAARKLIPEHERKIRQAAVYVLIEQLTQKQKPSVFLSDGLRQEY